MTSPHIYLTCCAHSTQHACMHQDRGALAKVPRMRNRGSSAPRRLQQGALQPALARSAWLISHMASAMHISVLTLCSMSQCSIMCLCVARYCEGCCYRAYASDGLTPPVCRGIMMCITLLASGFIIGACSPSITTASDSAAWTLPACACMPLTLDYMQCESTASVLFNHCMCPGPAACCLSHARPLQCMCSQSTPAWSTCFAQGYLAQLPLFT